MVPPPPRPFRAALVGAHFREEPVRFGPDGCAVRHLLQAGPPRANPDAPVYILLNRGLNAHVGWRRVSVEHARGLAAAGVASLRFDVAGLGESRDEPGRPANLIYSDLLLADIRAAVDLMLARGHARIALAGVCSGAYMALSAAHADPRVAAVVAVNAQRLVWNPREDVDEVIRYGLRSMNDYVGDLRSRGALRKLIRSRRRIAPAMRFMVMRTMKQALARVPIALRSRLLSGSMAARVARFFETLEGNGTRVSLVFTEQDPGLADLSHYYGPMAAICAGTTSPSRSCRGPTTTSPPARRPTDARAHGGLRHRRARAGRAAARPGDARAAACRLPDLIAAAAWSGGAPPPFAHGARALRRARVT